VPDVDKTLKIVHIITRLILGGAQENTLITCRLLAQRGHEVTLITGPAIGPEGQLFTQAKKDPYKIIVSANLVRQINPIKDLLAYWHIKGLLHGLEPDIIHTHSAKAGILGRYAGWSLKGKYDQNHIPAVIHTVHGLAFHPYQSRLKNKLYIAAEKAAAKRTDQFISVADAMSQQAINAGIGKPEQFTTAYSAIDEDMFLSPAPPEKLAEFRRRHNIPADAVVMVTIARLFELKGHDYIIESARKLAQKFPNAYWLFVGNGNLADYYKKTVAGLGLAERFRFTGLLPPEDVPLAIQASDILVHCSLREGLARALPQALLCAKPAVSFDLDGAKEVVNENTGRLIKPKDIQALTDACAELIQNRQLRQRLGQQGQNFVKEMFAPDKMVDTIEAVYEKAMNC